MDLKAKFERTYPYGIGVAAAIVAFKLAPDALAHSSSAGLDLRQVASAGLNIFGLLTGLLFSVYVLAIAPGGGFLERIFHTRTFGVFRRYVLEALVLGALATAAVIPLMATTVDSTYTVWTKPFLALVMFAAAGALAAFFRVAQVFLVLVGSSAKAGRR